MRFIVKKQSVKEDPDFVRYLDSAVAMLPHDVLVAMKAGCVFDVLMDEEQIVFRSKHHISILKHPDGSIVSIIEQKRKKQ